MDAYKDWLAHKRPPVPYSFWKNASLDFQASNPFGDPENFPPQLFAGNLKTVTPKAIQLKGDIINKPYYLTPRTIDSQEIESAQSAAKKSKFSSKRPMSLLNKRPGGDLSESFDGSENSSVRKGGSLL